MTKKDYAKFRVEFRGRKENSLGITYWIGELVEASTPEDVRASLYSKGYEHISDIRILEKV